MSDFNFGFIFLCYTELNITLTQQFVPLSLTSDCADKKQTKYSFFFVLWLGLPKGEENISEVKKMKTQQNDFSVLKEEISQNNVLTMIVKIICRSILRFFAFCFAV